MRKKYFLGFAIAICAILGFVVNEAKAETISILHVNDVHGHVTDSKDDIGYAKLETYFKQAKAENPNTLILDAGDTFNGEVYASFDQAQSVLGILQTMSFDAMTIGNHDVNYGLPRLKTLASQLSYPIICGNATYTDTGQPLFDGTKIMTLPNGIKVGLVGITTSVAGADNLTVTDQIATSKTLAAQIKPQVDIVVGLMHVGDAGNMTTSKIATEVPDFDVIVDGHSHTALPNGTTVGETLIAQAGSFSDYIGRIDIELDSREIVSKKASLKTKTDLSHFTPDVTTQTAVQSLINNYGVDLGQVIGSTKQHLTGEREFLRTKETILGNMLSDAVKNEMVADVALMRGSSMEGSIAAGDITVGDVLTATRSDTALQMFEVTGESLLSILKAMYTLDGYFPNANSMFLQVSGLTLKIDSKVEGLVYDVTVNGESLDLAKTYRVATDVVVANQEVLKSLTLKPIKELPSFAAVVRAYIEKQSPLNYPVLEGRITFTELVNPTNLINVLTRIQNDLPLTVDTLEKADKVAEIYQAFAKLATTEKDLISAPVQAKLEKATAQAGVVNHETAQAILSGNVPWYVRLVSASVSKTDETYLAFKNKLANTQDIFGLWQLSVLDTLNGEAVGFSEPVTITLKSIDLGQKMNPKIYHEKSDGTFETLEVTVDKTDISFKTSSFSPFALVTNVVKKNELTDKPVQNGTDNATKQNLPKTGESRRTILLITGLAIIGLVILMKQLKIVKTLER
ncbi:hypothetical protein RyT2_01570 [Pseudolactococcus yaeyamensis]